MNSHKKNILLHASVLLGCIIPFGNILGPSLIKTDDLNLKNNKKFILRFQILVMIILIILGAVERYYEIHTIKSGMPINRVTVLIWVWLCILLLFVYPVVNIIVLAFKKSPKQLCYPKIGR